jgi:hypothetical protein
MAYGKTHQSAFKTLLKHTGQTVVIHNNFNTPQATCSQARGIKNKGDRSSKIIFQFPDALMLSPGAVLQLEGSRDYWKVIDTEDIVIDGILIHFDVHVEKIDLTGQPSRPSSPHGSTFNVSGANARINIQSQDYSTNVAHQVTESQGYFILNSRLSVLRLKLALRWA